MFGRSRLVVIDGQFLSALWRELRTSRRIAVASSAYCWRLGVMPIAVAVSASCRGPGVEFSSVFRYGNRRCFPGVFPAHWRRVAAALPPRQLPVISRRFGVPFQKFWRVFFEATPKPLLRPHFRSVMPLGCNSAAQQNQSSIFLGELTCPSLSALLMLAMATSNSLMALMVNPSLLTLVEN